jgi:hypothetical protein
MRVSRGWSDSVSAHGPEAAYDCQVPWRPAAQRDLGPLPYDRANNLENSSMRFLSAVTASLLCAIPSLSFANCYSIYSPQDQLVYRSTVVPIDLSLPISDGLKARFPNHQLVFVANETMCTEVGAVANSGSAVQRAASRFTDSSRPNDSSLQTGGNRTSASGTYATGSGSARTPGTDVSVKGNAR